MIPSTCTDRMPAQWLQPASCSANTTASPQADRGRGAEGRRDVCSVGQDSARQYGTVSAEVRSGLPPVTSGKCECLTYSVAQKRSRPRRPTRRIQSRLSAGARDPRHRTGPTKHSKHRRSTHTHTHTPHIHTRAARTDLCPIQQHLCQLKCAAARSKATSKHREISSVQQRVCAVARPQSRHRPSRAVESRERWYRALPSTLACRVTARAMGWYSRTANKIGAVTLSTGRPCP